MAEPRADGPPAGFSRGVYESLIRASNLAHFKAAALLGLALTLTGFLLTMQVDGRVARTLHAAGVIFILIAAFWSAMAVYPKLAVRKGGQVFWGDISTHASAEAYIQSLRALEPRAVEDEYAATNFAFSGVLQLKFTLIRWSVVQLMIGCLLAAAGRALG